MSQNSGDLFLLNESLENKQNDFSCAKRELITTVDSNSAGGYPNGTITFDCASLSNSGSLVDPNMTLVIPTVLKVSGEGLTNANVNAYAASWKNHIHAIDSMNIQISNSSVVEVCEFSNIPASFKLLTEMTENELRAMGYSYGFFKDNAHSIKVPGADSALSPADTENNNDIQIVANAIQTPANGWGTESSLQDFGYNRAISDRMLDSSLDPAITGTNTSTLNAVGKNYCIRTAAAGGVPASVVFYGIMTLKLAHLNDFFKQCPLMRNSYMKMSFITNLISKTTVNVNTAENNNNFTNVSPNNPFTSALSAKCCPYMISGSKRGLNPTAGGGNITIESGIVRLTDTTPAHPIFQSCRLLTNCYTLNPEAEGRYFSNPVRKILYNAYYKTSVKVDAGASFNSFLVSNGISRIRSILLFPVLNDRTLLSPFSSCPTTTAPYAFLTNFNVKIGGSPYYSMPVNYSFEHFMQEIRERSLNGSKDFNGIQSGLINYAEWNAGYHFYYVDLSRKQGQGQDDLSKSITIEGTNPNATSLTFYVFVEYQKEIKLNVSTGQLIYD